MLGEETRKDMRGTNNNEQARIGGCWNDVITDENDILIYECSNEKGPRHPIFREGQDMSDFNWL